VAAASGSGYLWPADGPITSGFGYRRHPVLGTSRLHAGLDIGAGYGSEVYAAQSGVVILAGWNGGYGNCVMIEHPDGVVTLYGHMSELLVSEGESVGRGAVVGLVGSTGLSTGPHLHFETHIGGSPEDPLSLVG
jgi:murein DD-endopeptidase MepM/ murein hydrolase activator NlpD